MTKRLILIALAILVGISSYAYAEVQNIKVSGDIAVSGVNREAFTFRDARYYNNSTGTWVSCDDASDATDNFIMSTVRVRLDADLTDNVAAVVQLLNERIWGEEVYNESSGASSTLDADGTQINLDLAYMTFKEFLYSPLTLSVGRQNLRFGNALIVGDPDTNMTYLSGTPQMGVDIIARDLSARKAFDAVRATLDYSPLVVDLIFAKIDENNVTVNDDVTLYGVNANYDFGVMNTIGELYYFEKKDAEIKDETARDDIVRTLGARVQSEPIENLTLNAEAAHQFGHYVADPTRYPNDVRPVDTCERRDAWALQVGADYLFADLQYTPGVALWYTYLSGDKNETSGTAAGKFEGWDPMFEDQGGGTIYNAILGASNCHMWNLKGSLKPMDDLTAVIAWSHIRLVKNYTDRQKVYLSGIATNPYYYMTEKAHLGDEIDVVLTYDYTEDVQFGLNAGIFVPGDAFSNLSLGSVVEPNNRNASQIIGSMKVTF